MRIKRASIPIFQNEYKVERREEAKAKPIQDRSDPEYIGQRHQRIQDYVKNQIHFDQLKKKRQRDLSKISLEDYLQDELIEKQIDLINEEKNRYLKEQLQN